MTLSSAIFCLAAAALVSSIHAGSSQCSLGTRPYVHGPDAIAEVCRLNSSARDFECQLLFLKGKDEGNLTDRQRGRRSRRRKGSDTAG